MDSYNSEIDLSNDNGMLFRYIHFSLLLVALFLHFSFSQSILHDEYYRSNFIHTTNINLIIFINICYFSIFISNFINLNRFISRYFLNFIYYSLIATDFILKIGVTILNLFAILEPEFQFLIFYVWNIFLIINISLSYVYNNLSYVYNKVKIYKNRLPGYNIKHEDMCSICLVTESDWKLPCNHIFCINCINKWYTCKNTCPYCRQKIR
jgi:hypothetical protein